MIIICGSYGCMGDAKKLFDIFSSKDVYVAFLIHHRYSDSSRMRSFIAPNTYTPILGAHYTQEKMWFLTPEPWYLKGGNFAIYEDCKLIDAMPNFDIFSKSADSVNLNTIVLSGFDVEGRKLFEKSKHVLSLNPNNYDVWAMFDLALDARGKVECFNRHIDLAEAILSYEKGDF